MNIKKSFFLLIVLLGFAVSSEAQTSGLSPYSRLGMGDVVNPFLTNVRNMGGTGIAFTDAYIVNPTNPASYSYLKSSAFEVGLNAKLAQLKDNTGSTNVWSGNINNLSIAFPMRNPINDILDRIEKKFNWGMGVHLLPHSLVGYNLESEETSEELGKHTRNYNGNGGSYKFLWGNAVNYKDISVGVHLGYIFGNIVNNKSIVFDELSVAYNDYFKTDYHVSGFIWDAGMLYTIKLNEKKSDEDNKKKLKKIVFGLTFKSSSSFNTTANILNISQQAQTGLTDTLLNVSNKEGSGTLPGSYGFGVNYYNGNKWSIGVNYSAENWSNYKNEVNPSVLANSYRVSTGGFFKPNSGSYSSFFERVAYQFGAYYQKDPRSFQGQPLDSYGVTIGLGLPYVFKRKVSHANFGLDFGYKGQNSPLKEQYMKINFGFTFNDDSWFLKRKYN